MASSGNRAIGDTRNFTAQPARSLIDNLLLISVALLFARESFSGALRYYFDIYGFGILWFAVDALVLVVIIAKTLDILFLRDRVTKLALFIVFMITSGSIVGTIRFENLTAVFSAIKLLSPLLLLALSLLGFIDRPVWKKICLTLLILTILGVFFDRFVDFPWTGYAIRQFDVEVIASRARWIDGEERLAGFGSSNGNTARVILALGIFSVIQTNSKFWRLMIYTIALWGIEMTTTRTPMFALFAAMIFDFWPRHFFRGVGPGRLVILLVGLMSAVLPLSYGIINAPDFGQSTSGMDSIQERLYLTWPGVIEMIRSEGAFQAIIGHGFGSIGSPAVYTGRYVSPISAVDNYFMYLLFVFGFVGIVFYGFILTCLLRVSVVHFPIAIAALLSASITGNEGIPGLMMTMVAVSVGYNNIRMETIARRSRSILGCPN